MERGTIWFGILFLLVPTLLFLLAWALPAWSVFSALVALTLLLIGFTIVVGAMSI